MLYLKCTQKAQQLLGLKAQDVQLPNPEPTLLGDWYVMPFVVDRTQMLLFLSERTLLSFVAVGVRKDHGAQLLAVFMHKLDAVLRTESVSESNIQRLLLEYTSAVCARTDNRMILGRMNSLVADYKYVIADCGGLGQCNLTGLIRLCNRSPQRRMKMQTPVEALQGLLDQLPGSEQGPGMHPAYFQTLFVVPAEPRGVQAQGAGAGVSWPESFAIISAYATTGEGWSRQQSVAADEALAAELRGRHAWMRRVIGQSPDGAHAEPSWATNLAFDDACNLGQRFRQEAIYFVEGGALSVSYCDARRRRVPVPAAVRDRSFAEHLRIVPSA